jgi:hypothetical protein
VSSARDKRAPESASARISLAQGCANFEYADGDAAVGAARSTAARALHVGSPDALEAHSWIVGVVLHWEVRLERSFASKDRLRHEKAGGVGTAVHESKLAVTGVVLTRILVAPRAIARAFQAGFDLCELSTIGRGGFQPLYQR